MSWSPKKLRRGGLLLTIGGLLLNFIASDKERDERNEGYKKALIDTAEAASIKEVNKRMDLWEYRQIKDKESEKSEKDNEN